MRFINNLENQILEKNFKLTYMNNLLNIVNYGSIIHFDNNKIIIDNLKNSVVVSGSNLSVSKLLKDELLISGDIEKVEFR